jgi:hypothetical protein
MICVHGVAKTSILLIRTTSMLPAGRSRGNSARPDG